MRTEMRDKNEISREKRIIAVRIGQRIALLMAIVSIIAGIYFLRGNIENWYAKLKSVQQSDTKVESNMYRRIKFEPDDNNIFALYGSDLAILNKSSFKMFSQDNEELVSLSVGFSNPGMAVCRNGVVLFNRENHDIIIVDDSGMTDKIETDGIIMNLSVNDDGFIAVVEEDELYRAVVSIYNKNHKLVYQWKTSDYYVLNAEVSPSCDRLMAVGYTQDGGEFISRLIMLDIKEGTYIGTADIKGTVITNACFIGDDSISLIGDNASFVYSSDCKCLCTYNYGNDTIRSGAAGRKNTVITLTDRTSGLGGKLVMLDSKDNKAHTISTIDDVRCVGISDRYIVLLYTQSVQIFDRELNACSDEVNVAQVKRVLVNNEGRVMLIYGTDAGYVDLLSAFSGGKS